MNKKEKMNVFCHNQAIDGIQNNIKYHDLYSCNKCGKNNKITVKDYIEGIICEASTVCLNCGFKDYWAYGFFESMDHI